MVGLYQLLEENFLDSSNNAVNLYGVGISNHGENTNEKFLKEFGEELEKYSKVNYHRIAKEEVDRSDIEKFDMFEDEYLDNSLLIVPDASGFNMTDKNCSNRYREFLELTEENENLEAVVFTGYHEDIQRWNGNSFSKLERDIKRKTDSYAELMEVGWKEDFLIGSLK